MSSNLPYEMRETKRATLPPGPWDIEQNLYEFEAHGLKCVVMRMPFNGVLNGYVKAPSNDFIEWVDFSVHGGVTYHRTDERGQWIGFDTAHAWDLRPSEFGTRDQLRDQVYRDAACVIAETTSLAEQIANVFAESLFAYNYEATPC